MNKRAFSLDALRGYAILTMVLSATIASSVLPGWMYHAQEPPPDHVFNGNITGLTWVDLVFPFFLFAMGAAFPFSVGKKLERGVSKLVLCLNALKRGIGLTFFAIFIQHFYPYVISSPQDPRSWGLALLCFVILFPMFMRIPLNMPAWMHTTIKLLAYAIAMVLLLMVHYADGRKFDPAFSNIIILLLANVAVFGTIVYIFTANSRLARIAVLPFVMAVFLGSNIEGAWTQTLYNFTPFPWMYRFEYIRYLFIVIPGSVAGEYLMEWMRSPEEETPDRNEERKLTFGLLALAFSLIFINLCCLYARWLNLNLLLNVLFLGTGGYLLRKPVSSFERLWRKLFYAGAFILLLGLFFEPFQGGIRKDFPTYSYFFVTSGLAFMSLLIFSIVCDYYRAGKGMRLLVMSGQNPMIAYVATDLVTMPLLNLAGGSFLLDALSDSAWPGFFRGVILTGIAILITMFFTKIRWFWRT